MRRNLKQAGLLRQSLKLLPGVLIGSAIASPAFAAADIARLLQGLALDDLRLPILLGAVGLLVVGLALWVWRGNPAQKVHSNQSSEGFSEGIGRYRLKLGRGDAD